MNYSRRNLIQRLGGSIAFLASLGAITASGVIVAGHVREMLTPVEEQVPRWVFTARSYSMPLLYATTTIALTGGCAYYGPRRRSTCLHQERQ